MSYLFYKKNNSRLAYRVVCCLHQSDRRIRYVFRTNQIATFGYVSRTNHIRVFEYHAQITAFGYCFLVNDVIDTGLCTKNNINQKIWGSLDKCPGLWSSSSSIKVVQNPNTVAFLLFNVSSLIRDRNISFIGVM